MKARWWALLFVGNIAYLLLGGGVFHVLERKQEEERHHAAWLNYQAFLGRVPSQYLVDIYYERAAYGVREIPTVSIYAGITVLIKSWIATLYGSTEKHGSGTIDS